MISILINESVMLSGLSRNGLQGFLEIAGDRQMVLSCV